jgi:hypothetical protein
MNTRINRTKDKHFINSQIHDHLFRAHHGFEYAWHVNAGYDDTMNENGACSLGYDQLER